MTGQHDLNIPASELRGWELMVKQVARQLLIDQRTLAFKKLVSGGHDLVMLHRTVDRRLRVGPQAGKLNHRDRHHLAFEKSAQELHMLVLSRIRKTKQHHSARREPCRR